MVPAFIPGGRRGVGGIAHQFFKIGVPLQHLLCHLRLAAARRANQHHDARLIQPIAGRAGGVTVDDDLYQLQKGIVGVHRQHTGGLLVPGAAQQDGVGGVGLEHVVHAVVKEDVHVQLVLTGAHINMIGRDLGELLQNALGADAHKLGRHGGGDKDLGHLGEFAYKLLGTLDHRLGAEELGVAEVFKNHVGTGAQLAPAVHLIDGQGRIKLIFLIGQLDGIGDALHQQVVHIQRRGQAKLSVHIGPPFRKPVS